MKNTTKKAIIAEVDITEQKVVTVTDYELEIQRSGVTVGQFLAYVRARAKAKGLSVEMSAQDFANDDGWHCSYDWSTPDSRGTGCAAEVCKGYPFDKQTYCRGYDGSVYNEIIEFEYDDDKTGHGYYYTVQTHAPEEVKDNNTRLYFESVKKHHLWKIERNNAFIAKKEAELREHGEYMSDWGRSSLELDIKMAKVENANLADTVAECDELIAELEQKIEVEKLAEGGDLPVARFEIGKTYIRGSLYGSSRSVECIMRDAHRVTFRASWIAEDSGKLCHGEESYDIELEKLPDSSAIVERVEVFNYNGDKGYMYAATDEEIDAMVAAFHAEEEPALTVAKIREKVEATPARSAWSRGVKEYARELLEELDDAVEGGYFCAEDLAAPKLLERQLLNGARDWWEYSEGGCSLIYDEDIAERLCTPSELKRTKHGEKDPNLSENWIKCQGRALFQAAHLILESARV